MSIRLPLPLHGRATGFTLVELLLSTAIIALLMLVLGSITNQTLSVWRYSSGKIEQFQEARAAFDAMTTRLSQATLNTYWDYRYDTRGNPTRYERRSELRFISGQAEDLLGNDTKRTRVTHCVFFHAPLGLTESPSYDGLENLLNTWGYYLEFADDESFRPPFITPNLAPLRHRFRLMEFSQPTEATSIYFYTSGGDVMKPKSASFADRRWFQPAVNTARPPVHPIAENIVALIILPRLSKRDEEAAKTTNDPPDFSPLAPKYAYDSAPPDPQKPTGDSRYSKPHLNPTNQLPPVLQVTMVAIDESSAIRLGMRAGSADMFEVRGRFKESAEYSKDLLLSSQTDSLERTLVDLGVNFRTFSSNVHLRAAKWSREQTN